jgi:hypothetical protein
MDSSRIATSTLLQTLLRWSCHNCERQVQKAVGLVKKPTMFDFLRQETRSITRKLGHSSQCHSWDLNRESAGFKVPSLLITPLLKITILLLLLLLQFRVFLRGVWSSHRIFQPPTSAYLLPQLLSLLLRRFCSLYVSLLFTMLLLSVAAVLPSAVPVPSTAGGNIVGRRQRHATRN